MNHEAIYATYPQVVKIDESVGAFDAEGNLVELNAEKVNATAKIIKAEKDAKETAQAKEKQAILDRLGITAEEAALLVK